MLERAMCALEGLSVFGGTGSMDNGGAGAVAAAWAWRTRDVRESDRSELSAPALALDSR